MPTFAAINDETMKTNVTNTYYWWRRLQLKKS